MLVKIQNASNSETSVVELPVEVAHVCKQRWLSDIHIGCVHFSLEVLKVEGDSVVIAQDHQLLGCVQAHVLEVEGPQADVESDYVCYRQDLVVENGQISEVIGNDLEELVDEVVLDICE